MALPSSMSGSRRVIGMGDERGYCLTMAPTYRFGGFVLDPHDRLLTRDDAVVELNARYFDALVLLVREPGTLISKNRFLDDVWRGIPVTDEALTQCIKTLRRQLGDRAADPRLIETVPKHGYRFIAPVERVGDERESPATTSQHPSSAFRDVLLLGGAGTIGGGVAGLIGGIFYGFAGAAQPLQPGIGAASILLVLMCLTILAALTGGAGVAFGIAAAGVARDQRWRIAGGAVGGLIVGASAKLLGLDAFNLLLGQSPGDITGGSEGALLGAAIGLGSWLARRGAGADSLRRTILITGATGGAAGIIIPLLGGRLMGGSLDLLARSIAGTRLRLDPIGALFGERDFGPISQIVTGGLEGLLFGGCIAGAMLLARRGLRTNS